MTAIPALQSCVDVAVIGAGPAGVLAAIKLHHLGHRVLVLNKRRHRSAIEGLAPRTLDTLVRLGLTEAAACAGGPVTRCSHWNGQRVAANMEHLIDRRAFDSALVRDALRHDVPVINAAVTDCMRCDGGCDGRCNGGWQLHIRTPEGKARLLTTRFVVDARGRRALSRANAARTGPATYALARWYQGPPGSVFSAVCAQRQGWSWLARFDTGLTCIQAFMDANKNIASAERGRDALQRRHNAMVQRLPEALKDAFLKPVTPLEIFQVRDAGVRLSAAPVALDHIAIGDAAFCVDPLSGHGIFQALSSALAAVPVINTLLRRPDDHHLALGFYQRRVAERFAHQAAMGREVYAEEQRWPRERFWKKRRAWPDPAAPSPRPTTIAIRRQAVVEDGYIVERDVVLTPSHPQGVFSLGDVPLAPLWTARPALTTPEKVERIARRLGRDPARVQIALEWLAREAQG